MKISERTLQILSNFQKINNSIVLMPGRFLVTKSPEIGGSDSGEIFARAIIEEEWPMEFGIFDLSKFINTINLLGGASTDLDFHENHVILSNGNISFKYHKTPTNLISSPGDKVVKAPGDVTFDITESVLKKMERLSAVNDFPEISITGDGSTISMHGTGEDIDNTLTLNDLASYEGPEFSTCLKWAHLKMLPLDYHVGVKARQWVRFSSNTELGEIYYVVAALAKR